jgi:transposase
MDHIAIDLGGRESQICVRSGDGTILEETAWPTASLGKYLAKGEKSRVVVESCAEAFAVADAALQAGHEAVVVPASLVRALGVGSRGLKNDIRDGRNLSEASCRMSRLPSVHVPAALSRQRKCMCTAREALVSTRTKLINSARGWLRTLGVGGVRGGTASTLPTRFRKYVLLKTGDSVAGIHRATTEDSGAAQSADLRSGRRARAHRPGGTNLSATDDRAGGSARSLP